MSAASFTAVLSGNSANSLTQMLAETLPYHAAIAADRRLGGLCDWVEAEAPRPVDLPIEGAASLKAAVIPIILHYSTADPLV